MADVVFLGFGQSSGFDNKDITQIIGQEVSLGAAGVVLTGKGGPIIPASKEPETVYNDLPIGPIDVQFLGFQFSEPPPTMNPEVAYVMVPRDSGELVGPVVTVPAPDVVLGPIGESNSIENQPAPNGGFLFPAQTFTQVSFSEGNPTLPASLDPATNLPPAGPFLMAAPTADDAKVYLPGGTIGFIVNTNPQRYKTLPFPPAEVESNVVWAGTDAANSIYPKLIKFTDDTVTEALRGQSQPISSMSLDVNAFDIITCAAVFPATPTVFDTFYLIDAPVTRLTPVLDVFLG